MNFMSKQLKQALGKHKKKEEISSLLFKMYHYHKNDERILESISKWHSLTSRDNHIHAFLNLL